MYVDALAWEVLEPLAATVGRENVSVAAADLDQHSHDESFHDWHRPHVVVWPGSAREVSAILRMANDRSIPVTAWGAGTSIEGNPIPVCGGIVLDMRRMDRIVKVRPEDFQVDVQPGILYTDLNKALAHHGLFYAPDPGAAASIGGMVANNASGTRTLKYGATKDNVLRLQVVLASGEIICCGSHSIKSSSGYDLVHLFVGSEGTLGVVTEATLRLAPIPEKFSAVVASFSRVEQATRTVSAVIGSGVTPAALEFLDVSSARALNTTGEFQLPERPTLLMEFHSASEAGLREELGLVKEICESEHCVSFEAGLGRDERDRLWEVRHHAYETIVRNNPGRSFFIVDVAVPVSRYPELVATVSGTMESQGVAGFALGHAGDGNLHVIVPYISGDADNRARAQAANQAMVETALRLEGTATGEHGVGIGKRKFMRSEHGPSLDVMRSIKRLLDPNGILNPGKVFPQEGEP